MLCLPSAAGNNSMNTKQGNADSRNSRIGVTLFNDFDVEIVWYENYAEISQLLKNTCS